ILLVSCAAPAPTAAPTAAPTQASAATEAPAATQAPAATEASTVAVKPAIPYPDAPNLDVGGATVNRLPIEQLVTYKAMPEYHQPAWMDKLVADGTLPPVEERLPKEPQVYLTSGMKDGIGVYGDLWRGFSACPTAGYNDMAGTTMGWFGIESYTSRYGSLVKTGPLYRVDQDIIPIPEVAMSWEWSADGKELTMHLIEGAKWSDGVPFNADDVMFTWEGYILDDNVNAPRHQDAWTWDGKPATLEKVDDYTIKFVFPVSKPLDAFYLMNDENFHVMPAHQLKELHPKWSTADPKPDYKSFADALAPDDLPLVTLGPWVITEYKTDELMIMRRNPYYWKVDEAGNQLPYFDEIQYRKGPSGIGRDLCTIAGDCDHMNLENPSTFVQAMTTAQEPDAKYNVSWGPETLGYYIQFNLSSDVGVKTDSDKALRELFRDLRFRKALSYATDRDGIAQSIMKGPFLRGWAGGLYPGAPEFDKESVVYYPYDVESAKALLADIGLKDNDGDGILEWTSGPMAGKPVVIQLLASQDAKETQSVAEAVVNQWGAVGLEINMKIIDSQTHTDVDAAGTWDMSVTRGGQAFALPFVNVTALAPNTAKGLVWHLEGDQPRQMLDFEPQLVDIVNKYRSTFDAAERKQLMFEYNKIFTENVYNLGVFVGRYGLGTAKRVKNIPDGTPVFMYTWVEDAILLDTLWTPLEEQLPQNRPETIPVYGS
ncbi:MAG TPA: ABC transporter substrate-binding protein, partial [Anaerolineales bacterium]|nr:ABC transporter substrate-binding protein [Anaerolineales bacterium]